MFLGLFVVSPFIFFFLTSFFFFLFFFLFPFLFPSFFSFFSFSFPVFPLPPPRFFSFVYIYVRCSVNIICNDALFWQAILSTTSQPARLTDAMDGKNMWRDSRRLHVSSGWLGIALHRKSDWPVRCWRHSSNDTLLCSASLSCSGLLWCSALLATLLSALESD